MALTDGGGNSAFGRLRPLVAIPTSNQIDTLRLVFDLLDNEIKMQGLREPSKRFDLRFTHDDFVGNFPLRALILFDRVDEYKLVNGELVLCISHNNLCLVATHEVAHHFDVHCFEPYGELSSSIVSEFEEWREIIWETATFQFHVAVMGAQTGLFDVEVSDGENTYTIPTFNDSKMDAGIWGETFARCFTQYFVHKWAKRPEDPIHEVVQLFESERSSQLAQDYYLYWTDEEMAKIEPAMASILMSE